MIKIIVKGSDESDVAAFKMRILNLLESDGIHVTLTNFSKEDSMGMFEAFNRIEKLKGETIEMHFGDGQFRGTLEDLREEHKKGLDL